ncbi:MAG: phosphomannomutase/phosphoglucomutase [Chloroflexota bacterium]
MTTQVNSFMFRAYDIRGVVGEDLTEDVAGVIGRGIGTYLQQRGSRRLIVGQDNRPSSEKLKARLIESLLSTGCDVMDIGLCTTPMMYAAVIAWKMDGGVAVTASHNPAQFNGFKVVAQDAYPIGGDDIQDLLKVTLSGSYLNGKGQYSQKDFTDEYLAKILKENHMARPIKVAIDTGNAVAGIVAPQLLKALGCEVVELFTDLDGNFPNHQPDPEKASNLDELGKVVLKTGAEVGFGFDGDGDRLGLIDEKGEYREADYILMLLAQDFLSRHPGEKILIDVKTSLNTIDYIQKLGGQPFMWKTGHSLVKQKMREEGVKFGGELSGHMFMFEDYYPIDDAAMASARLVSFLSHSTKKISDYFSELPKLYSTLLIEMPCPDDKKFQVIENVKNELLKHYTGFTEDGIRANMPGGWALVRASNTGAKISMRFEADTPQRLDAIEKEVRQIIATYMP